MARLLTILSLLLSLSALSADDGKDYYASLKNNIRSLDTISSVESIQSIVEDIESLVKKHKTEWLPSYWAAYSNVLAAYISSDGKQKDKLLDKAQVHLDRTTLLGGKNEETHILQSWIYSARIEVSPMSRGMTYLPKSSNELEKAKELDPDNPRYHYLKGMILYNSPPMFGGNKNKACDHFEKSIELFESEDPKSDIHPNWGKDQAVEAMQKCN